MGKEKIMGDLFLAENEADEASQLMGKVNALHNIWSMDKDLITPDLVSAVLGFQEFRDNALNQANDKANEYWGWYTQEEDRNRELREKIDSQEKELVRLHSLLRLEQEQIKASGNAIELKGMED